MLQFSPLPLRQGFEGNSLISAGFVLVSYAAECLEVSLLFPPFQVVCLPPSLCHLQVLVSLSDFLLLFPRMSIHHFFLSSPCSFLSHFFSVSCFTLISLFRFSPLLLELLSLILPPPPPTLYSAVICDFGKEHIYWGGISPWQRSRW